MSIQEHLTPETTEQAPAKKRRFSLKNNRKLRLGATATAVTAVVIAAVVVLNVVFGLLADRFPWSLDLTENKTYTLSEQSHEVAEKVTQDVSITVFAEEGIFSSPNTGYDDLNVILRQFYQFTKDYGTLTDGKVSVSYLDLEANPTLANKYADYDVTNGSILFQCGQQAYVMSYTDLFSEESDYYSGQVAFTSLVEQKLASSINRVCGGKTVTLTFLTGHGEDQTAISALKSIYELNGYNTATVDFTTASAIDETTGALILAGPSKDFTVDEIKRLRAWLSNNGAKNRHLMVLCNYTASCPNLYEFLTVDYGIAVTDNLIQETDTANIPMDYYGSYPFYPLTSMHSTDLTMDADTDDTVIMPLTLQLQLTKDADSEKLSLSNHKLVSFGETAKLVNMAQVKEAEDEATLTGTAADSYPVVGMAYAYDYTYDSNNNRQETYVVVSGSTGFASYATASQYANEELVLMPMRTMCSLGDTTVISGQDLAGETLTFTNFTVMALGIGVFTVGLPLVLVVIALVVFFKRRHL